MEYQNSKYKGKTIIVDCKEEFNLYYDGLGYIWRFPGSKAGVFDAPYTAEAKLRTYPDSILPLERAVDCFLTQNSWEAVNLQNMQQAAIEGRYFTFLLKKELAEYVKDL